MGLPKGSPPKYLWPELHKWWDHITAGGCDLTCKMALSSVFSYKQWWQHRTLNLCTSTNRFNGKVLLVHLPCICSIFVYFPKISRKWQVIIQKIQHPPITALLRNLHIGSTPTPNAVNTSHRLEKSLVPFRPMCSDTSKESMGALVKWRFLEVCTSRDTVC